MDGDSEAKLAEFGEIGKEDFDDTLVVAAKSRNGKVRRAACSSNEDSPSHDISTGEDAALLGDNLRLELREEDDERASMEAKEEELVKALKLEEFMAKKNPEPGQLTISH